MIIYRQQRFAFFTLLEHTELTLSLTEKARRKAPAKARRLMNDDRLARPPNARPGPPTAPRRPA